MQRSPAIFPSIHYIYPPVCGGGGPTAGQDYAGAGDTLRLGLFPPPISHQLPLITHHKKSILEIFDRNCNFAHRRVSIVAVLSGDTIT